MSKLEKWAKRVPEATVAAARILILDDDAGVLNGLTRCCRVFRPGWHITTTSSASQALKLLRRDVYDVVVSDIFMPGMDGLEFIVCVRQFAPRTVVIAMTGGHDMSAAFLGAASSLGADRALAKPVGTKEFIVAVEESLRSEKE